MTGHVALIRLSWPARALWQNRRVHWAEKSRAVKAYRQEAWARALEQKVKKLDTTSPRLVFTFHPPKGRGRLPDVHNLPATQKAAIDGIADAMGCDDAGFRCEWPTKLGRRVPDGCVMVEVSE